MRKSSSIIIRNVQHLRAIIKPNSLGAATLVAEMRMNSHPYIYIHQ